MKKLLPLLVFLLATVPLKLAAQWPFSQGAVLISVDGQVTVTDKNGKARSAMRDSEVLEGETVETTADSRALLRFFDGSTLELKAGTRLTLTALKHPMDREKELRFTLLGGLVQAIVKKLETSSSLFEVEAGGVVCGVRGTQFSVTYEPTGGTVDLKVAEGVVYAKASGQTYFVHAGEEKEFKNGHPLSGLTPGGKFAGKDRMDKDLDPTGIRAGSLSLMDLSNQFVWGISVNGTTLSVASPMGSMANPGGISLGGAGNLSLAGGLPSLGTIQLGALHLKLP